MEYDAIIRLDGRQLLAEFPDAPGCQTFAGSDAALRSAAHEALEGWLEANLATGQMPPRARTRRRAPAGARLWRVAVEPALAVAIQIRWARHDAGLTQAALAARAGVSQQQIAKLERSSENPTLGTLAKVALALGVALDVRLGSRRVVERVLEPEVMDTEQDARAYDAMDHRAVNGAFVTELLALSPTPKRVLDLGTGTGLIAVVLATRVAGCVVTAVDASGEMLKAAARNVERAGLRHRVALVRVGTNGLGYRAGDFDLVMSNSVVHHVPDVVGLLREVARVAGERAGVFVRDLVRPEGEAEVGRLVERYGGEDAVGRELLRASLCAALTAEEVERAAEQAGLRGVSVRVTSDRHWTMARG